MNWRIEEKEAFEVFGIEKCFAKGESIPAFWTECYEKGLYQKLLYDAASASDPDRESPGVGVVRAISGYEAREDGGLVYMIYAPVREGCRTEGYKIVQIPKAAWAVFQGRPAKRPAKYISKLYHQAYKKWLPGSGYARAPGPDMEVYNVTGRGKHRDEVWIPVKNNP